MARCEGCGAPRSFDVTSRQAARIRAGHSGSLCRSCRAGPVEAGESDYRFWLTMFGVKVPRGANALDVVRASGLPEDLADLATEFVRDFPR